MVADPFKYFRVEARELLEQLGQGTLDLERSAAPPESISRLLRLAHTLKGAARVVRQTAIADRAHELEDALSPLRDTTAMVPREQIEHVLTLLDTMGEHLAHLGVSPDAAPLVSRPVDDVLRSVRADVGEMDTLLDAVAQAHTLVTAMRRHLTSTERAQRLVHVLVEQRDGQPGSDPSTAGRSADRTRAMTAELQDVLGDVHRGFASGVELMDRELRQVRDAAEQMRLVPAAAIFTSLERTVRDVAQSLGKRVGFAGSGGDIRLDVHVIGPVQAALVQVVRNAVAHGIESTDERRVAGKPLEGRVSLDVTRRGRRVIFLCRDDGRGVDLEAVRRVAQRRGLHAADGSTASAAELLRLLLRGGISTAAAVSDASGRGVGLDVVRETAERLGGEVIVQTEAQRGTTVELAVPLSLASLEALVVECAGVVATIPLDAVRQAVRVTSEEIVRTATGEAVLAGGTAIPFAPLSRLLGRDPAGESHRGSTWSAVLVHNAAGEVAAVGVDRLRGTVGVVFRPLPALAPAAALVAGASLDVDGNPQLVLDPDGLIAAVRAGGTAETAAAVRRRPILVIDDSLTTRMLEQSILESAGFIVDVATSAEDGLLAARQTPYALFLVDVEMPGMDGFAFIEHARADALLRDVPAILVTSRAAPEDRQRGELVGAQGYVTKGEFDQVELLARIRRLVG